jgi:hypothetical protein
MIVKEKQVAKAFYEKALGCFCLVNSLDISVYLNDWFPNVPGSYGFCFFSILLIYINATNINTFF